MRNSRRLFAPAVIRNRRRPPPFPGRAALRPRLRPVKAHIFAPTQAVWLQAEDLQNFSWPTLAAIYWLQERVRRDRHDVTTDELKRRYFDPVGVQTTRTGFNATFFDLHREQIEERLAVHHLFDLCGLYETWAEALAQRFAVTGWIESCNNRTLLTEP